MKRAGKANGSCCSFASKVCSSTVVLPRSQLQYNCPEGGDLPTPRPGRCFPPRQMQQEPRHRAFNSCPSARPAPHCTAPLCAALHCGCPTRASQVMFPGAWRYFRKWKGGQEARHIMPIVRLPVTSNSWDTQSSWKKYLIYLMHYKAWTPVPHTPWVARPAPRRAPCRASCPARRCALCHVPSPAPRHARPPPCRYPTSPAPALPCQSHPSPSPCLTLMTCPYCCL